MMFDQRNGYYYLNGIKIESFDIVPYTFTELINMNKTNSIQIRLHNVISEGIDKKDIVNLTVENLVKHDSYLIVMGGWIPCSFLNYRTLLLADRNVVSEIIRRYSNGRKRVNEEEDSFDNIFLNMNVNLDLSPFLLEGNAKKLPTNEQIDEQYSSVYNELKSALPELQIATYPTSHYHNTKDKLAPIIDKRIIFLEKIVPKINKQFKHEDKEKAVKLVFQVAEEVELEKSDLVILVALLRIIIKGNKSPAQLVLKDSQSYSKENAYNAVFDLVTIELLINNENNNSIYKNAFITRDKGLSLFSSLLNNTKVSGRIKSKFVITSTILSEIFGNDVKLIEDYKKWLNAEI